MCQTVLVNPIAKQMRLYSLYMQYSGLVTVVKSKHLQVEVDSNKHKRSLKAAFTQALSKKPGGQVQSTSTRFCTEMQTGNVLV